MGTKEVTTKAVAKPDEAPKALEALPQDRKILYCVERAQGVLDLVRCYLEELGPRDFNEPGLTTGSLFAAIHSVERELSMIEAIEKASGDY